MAGTGCCLLERLSKVAKVQLKIHNTSGKVVGEIEIRDDVFGEPFNEAVVHQVLVAQLANRRQGTADTKTRGEVSASSRKLYPQKHTGRARRGDASSPVLRGGGGVFGPHPRCYRKDVPKKVRRLALRCVLSAKAGNGQLIVLDKLELESPKTREMANILTALGVDDSAIIAASQVDDKVVKSARNLPDVKIMLASLLNVADLLSYRYLVMPIDAVRVVEDLWSVRPKSEVVTGAK